jgi:hypothetical protein
VQQQQQPQQWWCCQHKRGVKVEATAATQQRSNAAHILKQRRQGYHRQQQRNMLYSSFNSSSSSGGGASSSVAELPTCSPLLDSFHEAQQCPSGRHRAAAAAAAAGASASTQQVGRRCFVRCLVACRTLTMRMPRLAGSPLASGPSCCSQVRFVATQDYTERLHRTRYMHEYVVYVVVYVLDRI